MLSGSRPARRSTPLTSRTAQAIANSGTARTLRGGTPRTAATIARMWSGVVPQHPPTMFTKPLRAKSRDHRGGLRRRLVVTGLGHRVGQSGIRIARYVRIGDTRQFFDVRAHQCRAERAIESHGQRPNVPNRVPERLGRLARQRASRRIGDRARDDDRQPSAATIERLLDREERRLGVQRVENGFDQQQVGAAVDQSLGRLRVRRDQLVVLDVARAGIVHVRRDRCGPIRRSERAGDEPRPLGCPGGPAVGALARDPRGGFVDRAHLRFHPVVRLGNAGCAEGVRLDDVGARLEIGVVDRVHRLRLRHRQHVVVTREVARMVVERTAEIALRKPALLDHRPHCAIENEDPFGK